MSSQPQPPRPPVTAPYSLPRARSSSPAAPLISVGNGPSPHPRHIGLGYRDHPSRLPSDQTRSPVAAPPAVADDDVTKGYVPWSMSSIVPCAPSNINAATRGQNLVQHPSGIRDKRPHLLGAPHIRQTSWPGREARFRFRTEPSQSHSSPAHAASMCVSATQAQQIHHPQGRCAPSCLRMPDDAPAGGRDLLPARSALAASSIIR